MLLLKGVELVGGTFLVFCFRHVVCCVFVCCVFVCCVLYCSCRVQGEGTVVNVDDRSEIVGGVVVGGGGGVRKVRLDNMRSIGVG